MKAESDFEAIYAKLRAILMRWAQPATVLKDEPGDCILLTTHVQANRQFLYFAAVQIKKNYVSYHLVPVYACPEMLTDVSPALRKRMQGKACFNFSRQDDALFAELADITQRGFERFREKGFFKADSHEVGV